MTLDELALVDREYLTPAEVAPVLGISQYGVNVAARAGKLSVPFIIVGTRVKICRESDNFLQMVDIAFDRCEIGVIDDYEEDGESNAEEGEER